MSRNQKNRHIEGTSETSLKSLYVSDGGESRAVGPAELLETNAIERGFNRWVGMVQMIVTACWLPGSCQAGEACDSEQKADRGGHSLPLGVNVCMACKENEDKTVAGSWL